MPKKNLDLNKQAIAASFSAAAYTYDQNAFVEQQIGQRLLERLQYVNLQPKCILDLGCGTGYFSKQLQQLYPDATIIGLDIAYAMLSFAKDHSDLHYCCGDAEQLPFAAQQFDLVFSNCCFPSLVNFEVLFAELQRILKIDGLLLFTTLGPDTLQEFGFENKYKDMHLLGDLLTQLQYKNPVVDMEYLTFTYNTLREFLEDLQHSGGFNIDFNAIADLNLPCSARFEVIYGQAWKQKVLQQVKDQHGNVLVPVSAIEYI